MPSTFPTAVDTFVDPQPTSKRISPSLAGESTKQNDAIKAVEQWLISTIYAPAGGSTGQFLVLDSNGHPVWESRDYMPATTPTVKEVGATGASMLWQGGGTNPDWTTRVNQAVGTNGGFEVRKATTTLLTVQAPSNVAEMVLGYGGGAGTRLVLNSDNGSWRTIFDNSEVATTDIGGTEVYRASVSGLLEVKDPTGGTWRPASFGTRKAHISTAAPTGGDGVDNDMWLRYVP